MRHNLNLNWLRSFEAAARLLSFTAASLEIGLTQTAVSQHIKALEAQLGDKLFVRRPKSLQLTDVGKAYLLTVREALDTIEMSTTGLFGPRQASTIVLRASMAFIVWISPRLGAFLHEHPDTGVKLVTSIWKGPADQQPVDVDIILGPNEHARADLEKLSEETIVPICGTALARDIRTPQDLLLQKPIHIMGFDDHWARYLSAFALKPALSGGHLVTDTATTAIEMVAAGLGCAAVIERFARQAIEAGRDISIVGDPVALGQSHFLVRAERRASAQPAVEAFEAWLRRQF
ncbi:LysR family transcriptional regulator [uncultured Roseovarius sp.]|uniref:LysR family transcriptional regulator n=1 Tax=uncultured Roseovarius sp. TaxID=293344 RepID=UPI00262D205C|nr:LysR family transcriptional regulator [uncultured Roseovarius sp.]